MSTNPFAELALQLSEISEKLDSIAPSQATPVEVINRDELMKRLNISEPTAIRYERSGKIPSFRIGSNVRYNWIEVVKALENQKR